MAASTSHRHNVGTYGMEPPVRSLRLATLTEPASNWVIQRADVGVIFGGAVESVSSPPSDPAPCPCHEQPNAGGEHVLVQVLSNRQ